MLSLVLAALTYGPIVATLAFFVIIVLVIRSDCDLTLGFYEKYGAKPEAKLRGKVVWITGASSGIGEALAYELASCGSIKLVLSARRERELQRVERKCRDIAGTQSDSDFLVLPMDISDYDSHRKLTEVARQRFGKVDILVHNSGISQAGLVHRTSLEVVQKIFEVNTLGVISLTNAVLPHMMNRRAGHFVFTGSISQLTGFPKGAAYGATKSALHRFFESLRNEVRCLNIDFTLLTVGPTQTQIIEKGLTEEIGRKYQGPTMAEAVQCTPMTTDRCARLIAVATANRLFNTWICIQPLMFLLFLGQYLPSLTQNLYTLKESDLSLDQEDMTSKKMS